MSEKLYLVVYKDEVNWLGKGILYMGNDKDKATIIYNLNIGKVNMFEYYFKDDTICEVN